MVRQQGTASSSVPNGQEHAIDSFVAGQIAAYTLLWMTVLSAHNTLVPTIMVLLQWGRGQSGSIEEISQGPRVVPYLQTRNLPWLIPYQSL